MALDKMHCPWSAYKDSLYEDGKASKSGLKMTSEKYTLSFPKVKILCFCKEVSLINLTLIALVIHSQSPLQTFTSHASQGQSGRALIMYYLSQWALSPWISVGAGLDPK